TACERAGPTNEVGQGPAYFVQVGWTDASMWLRLCAQCLIPHGLPWQRAQEIVAVLQPKPCQLRVELGPAALPHDRIRDVDSTDLVVCLGYVDQVHKASGRRQTFTARQRRKDLAVPSSVRMPQRLGNARTCS